MEAFFAFLFFLISQPAQSALIPAGTRVDARLESLVTTSTSNAGDAVVAVITDPIRAAGEIVVPRGSRLIGRVETIEPATPTTEGRVRLVFREMQFPDGRKVSTWITNSFSASPPKRKIRYVLYMAIGTAAGGLIGGKSARTAGIIGGSLAGFIIAGNTENEKLPDLTLKPGRMLQLQFREDFRLQP